MKNNISIIVVSLVFLIIFGFIYYHFADFNRPNNDEKFLKKIEQLEKKIESLNDRKDSIRTVIDSTHVKIITNEKHYQERITTILSEPDSFSESFTRQYLRDYAATRGYRIIGASETE